MKYGALVVLISLSIAMPFCYVRAQSAQSLYGNINDISIAATPENPQANQEVTLTIQSYLLDISSADISWSIDGKKVQTGVGITTFKFTTKDVGVPTVIDVSILPVGGELISKEVTITPSTVDILWEATDSSVSPFYKGKALPTSEANLKFVAIPNIKTTNGIVVDPKDIVYNWSKDYEVVASASGYGKDSYTMQMPITDTSENVSVVAQMRGGGSSASQQVTTAVFDPKIVWYATSPLYGPQFESAINDGFTIHSNDVSVFAQPFFASPKNVLAPNLSYAWQLNDSTLDPQTPANILSLHRNTTNNGDAVVSLTIENADKYLQELTSSITLHMQ